jgi:hypothetical protein
LLFRIVVVSLPHQRKFFYSICTLFFAVLTVVDRYATSGVEETMELLHRGNQNRAVEPTKRNETSSRSHAVLQIVIDKEMKTAAIQKTILIGNCL